MMSGTVYRSLADAARRVTTVVLGVLVAFVVAVVVPWQAARSSALRARAPRLSTEDAELAALYEVAAQLQHITETLRVRELRASPARTESATEELRTDWSVHGAVLLAVERAYRALLAV